MTRIAPVRIVSNTKTKGDRKVRRMRERATLMKEGRHRPKPFVPEVCPGGTDCETVDAGRPRAKLRQEPLRAREW